MCLPWDIGHTQSVVMPSSSPTDPHSSSSKFVDLGILKHVQPRNKYADVSTSLYGLPLSPAEYRSFFEVSHPLHTQIFPFSMYVHFWLMVKSERRAKIFQKLNIFQVQMTLMGEFLCNFYLIDILLITCDVVCVVNLQYKNDEFHGKLQYENLKKVKADRIISRNFMFRVLRQLERRPYI